MPNGRGNSNEQMPSKDTAAEIFVRQQAEQAGSAIEDRLNNAATSPADLHDLKKRFKILKSLPTGQRERAVNALSFLLVQLVDQKRQVDLWHARERKAGFETQLLTIAIGKDVWENFPNNGSSVLISAGSQRTGEQDLGIGALLVVPEGPSQWCVNRLERDNKDTKGLAFMELTFKGPKPTALPEDLLIGVYSYNPLDGANEAKCIASVCAQDGFLWVRGESTQQVVATQARLKEQE